MSFTPQAFSGFTLDRASSRRDDAVWMSDAHGRGVYCLVSGSDVLVENGRLVLSTVAFSEPVAFIGDAGTSCVFACDGTAETDTRKMTPLRAAAAILPADELAIAGTASAIVTWNRTHRFCGRCGGTTTSFSAGWKRVCDQCKTEQFPRTDPVAIMLVTHGDRCLVARQARWPAKQMSALAGFIEPGETPEEAVRREVFEEVGLRVGAVHYLGAQPWPFPLSLMLGFHCEAQSLDFNVDASEIERAVWLTQPEARAALDGTHPDVRAPGPYAIAHHLLRAWAFR